MALFLAESPSSRTLWIGTALALALGASLLSTPCAEPPRARVHLGKPRACKELLEPRHIYVSADNQRALDVALLTVAEHPEWQVHIASDAMGGEQLPGYRLVVSTEFIAARLAVAAVEEAYELGTGEEPVARPHTFQCSAMVIIEEVPRRSPIAEVHSDATATRDNAAYESIVNDACITSTVEDAVEQALEYLPKPR